MTSPFSYTHSMFSERTPNGLFKSDDGRFLAWNDGTSGGMTALRDKHLKTVEWFEDTDEAAGVIEVTLRNEKKA